MSIELDYFDPKVFGGPAIDPGDIPPDVEPFSNEPDVDGDLNAAQALLLLESIRWLWRDRNDFYASGNLSIYYALDQVEGELGKPSFRGPDFFVVLGAEKRQRRSWTVWREGGKYPNVIIEILSPCTVLLDHGLKKQLYQDVFRTPEYFLFDPIELTLEGYGLRNGVYGSLSVGFDGRLKSEQLGLTLGVHKGELRFFTTDGAVLKTAAEVYEERVRFT